MGMLCLNLNFKISYNAYNTLQAHNDSLASQTQLEGDKGYCSVENVLMMCRLAVMQQRKTSGWS